MRGGSRGRCALPQDLNKTHSPRQTARQGEWRAAEAPRGQRPHNQSAHPARPGQAPCGEATAHRRPSAGTTPNSVKDDYPPLLQRRAEVVARHGQGCVSRPTGLRCAEAMAEAPIGLERPISSPGDQTCCVAVAAQGCTAVHSTHPPSTSENYFPKIIASLFRFRKVGVSAHIQADETRRPACRCRGLIKAGQGAQRRPAWAYWDRDGPRLSPGQVQGQRRAAWPGLACSTRTRPARTRPTTHLSSTPSPGARFSGAAGSCHLAGPGRGGKGGGGLQPYACTDYSATWAPRG